MVMVVVAALVVVVVVVMLWRCLFITRSINLDDPPDDHDSDRCPAIGMYVRQVVISEVEGVSGLPLLGRMIVYVLTHALTYTLTHTTTLEK